MPLEEVVYEKDVLKGMMNVQGETVRFIGNFDPIVNVGKYMYHCHILEHEAAGMMGIFEIL